MKKESSGKKVMGPKSNFVEVTLSKEKMELCNLAAMNHLGSQFYIKISSAKVANANRRLLSNYQIKVIMEFFQDTIHAFFNALYTKYQIDEDPTVADISEEEKKLFNLVRYFDKTGVNNYELKDFLDACIDTADYEEKKYGVKSRPIDIVTKVCSKYSDRIPEHRRPKDLTRKDPNFNKLYKSFTNKVYNKKK